MEDFLREAAMGRRLVGLESVDSLVRRNIDRDSISGCHVRCRCARQIVLGGVYNRGLRVKVWARVMRFAPPRPLERLLSTCQTFASFTLVHFCFV